MVTIPTRTVARLKIRLRNQKMLTRMADGLGEKVREGRAIRVVPLLAAIWERRLITSLSESGCSVLYDSIMNAVTTAENRPALRTNQPSKEHSQVFLPDSRKSTSFRFHPSIHRIAFFLSASTGLVTSSKDLPQFFWGKICSRPRESMVCQSSVIKISLRYRATDDTRLFIHCSTALVRGTIVESSLLEPATLV